MRFLLTVTLIISQLIDAQILINEYSAANYSDFQDNFNEYEDWFEIFNAGSEPFDLNGYYLSDKSNNLTKYLKVKSSKTYMIGHTVHDIEMVKNAKINTIAVTWGYNAKEELKRPSADYILNYSSELVKILRGL